LSHLFSLLLSALLFLGGCSHSPQPLGKPLPQLSYDNLNPYTIHGGSVRVQQSFSPDNEQQILVEEFPIAPDRLIQRYANRRFVTTGALEKLIFDIKDASIVKISDEENMVGFLSGAATDYYKFNILITMTPVRADGLRVGPFTIKFSRDLSIPQNASLAEREFRQFEMLEKSIQAIDRAVTDMVQNKMIAEYF